MEDRKLLPAWRSHKEVEAFKVHAIGVCHGDGPSNLFELASEYGHFATVNADYMKKHQPQIGGYYVRYRDGYESFSPAQAFESGYVSLDGYLRDEDSELHPFYDNITRTAYSTYQSELAKNGITNEPDFHVLLLAFQKAWVAAVRRSFNLGQDYKAERVGNG